METLRIVCQLVIAVGIANVWLVRSAKATAFRGGDAQDMKAEFAAYGLPGWSMQLIGAAKLTLAVALIVGIWVPSLVFPAAIGMSVLMLGAVSMHIKISDPLRKAVPALCMLGLSATVALTAL